MTIDEILRVMRQTGMNPADHFDMERVRQMQQERQQQQATTPQHGAIDYRKRPDGVWEMPR